jgi:uncharacterized membrane protein
MLKLVKTTVLGGLIFLLPLAVLGYVLGKIIATAEKLAEPLSDKLPVSSVAGVSATIIVAVVGLFLVSFLAGLFARTRIAQNTVKQLENRVLSRVPAYGLIKSLGTDIISPEQEAARRVVLVRFDDSWQLGVKAADAGEESHTVVFLPDSPTAHTGTVVIVESSRVQVTDIPLHKAMTVMSVRGLGLQELLRGQLPAAAPA